MHTCTCTCTHCAHDTHHASARTLCTRTYVMHIMHMTLTLCKIQHAHARIHCACNALSLCTCTCIVSILSAYSMHITRTHDEHACEYDRNGYTARVRPHTSTLTCTDKASMQPTTTTLLHDQLDARQRRDKRRTEWSVYLSSCDRSQPKATPLLYPIQEDLRGTQDKGEIKWSGGGGGWGGGGGAVPADS